MIEIKMCKTVNVANCAAINAQQQQQLQQQQKQQNVQSVRRRKCKWRKKYKCTDESSNNNNNSDSDLSDNLNMNETANSMSATIASPTTATTATTTTSCCNYNNSRSRRRSWSRSRSSSRGSKICRMDKILITTSLLLLIAVTTTLIAATATSSFQVAAMTFAPTTTSSSISLLIKSAATTTATLAALATPTLQQPQQQQQQQQQQYRPLLQQNQYRSLLQQQQTQQKLQQQQLFAMLTKNRQATATATTTTTTPEPISGLREKSDGVDVDNVIDGDGTGDGDGVGNVRQHRVVMFVADDETAASLETTGFVADDGQQYEKAERVLAAAAAANGNNNNGNNNNQFANTDCPKECKCLNVYFDCGKQHLDRVPTLPNYVQILDLLSNKLNDSSVMQIQNLPELHKLSLKRNQLESVPKFIGLSALKQLNLAHNRIQRISSESLAALPKLKALDLSRNYLHTLESSYFPPRNKLAHLILNSNEISHVAENTFESLGDLLDLELNSNRLTTLPTGVFRNLNKLRKLSMNFNHLEINWSTFKGLFSLQKLCLKSNNIRALQDGVFHVMRGIETIELDHNGITSLSRQGLFNLTKLHHLSLSNNSISRIELDTWEFTQSLITLDLSYNNISEFKPQHLDCLQRLRQLNLSHNKIQYLLDTTFDCVKNLEDLNLRRNKLAWIIEDQSAAPPFRSLRKLKRLDLYGNNLKQINSKSLSGLSSLETLNLGGNALASIQSGAFDYMTQLQKLVFKSSNFICDCELLWFRRWLQKNAQANPQLQQNAVCGYPDHLLDREVLSLTPAELICADTPKPVVTQEPSNQLAVKGANVTMECIANSPMAASLAAADELKIKWRHDNQHVRGERLTHQRAHSLGNSNNNNNNNAHIYSYSQTETQIHHDPASNQTVIIGYLRLYNVSYESAGRYQCVVSNAFGTTYSQKFKISIGIHPSFLQIPSNLTIDSGDTARLVCSAAGDPTPEIALQKFGGADFPAATERRLQVIREENAFLITNAKPIDTGIYTCTAESAAGEIKVNASLVVNDKPQPKIPLIQQETVLGDSSVLECLNEIAAELNDPHREWYKDNKPFHTSSTSVSERFYFTGRKELLVIVNTQSMDAGHYRCDITDNSKTFSIQSELIVVKEDFSQNVIIIGVLLVTVTCIVIGSLIVWAILFYQKRKLNANHRRPGGVTVGGSRVAAADDGEQRICMLNETELTSLNRTYGPLTPRVPLRPQKRPYSLVDFDYPPGGVAIELEPLNRLVITKTPNIEELLQQRGAEGELPMDAFVPEYLPHVAQIDASGAENQDHLSNKDSGTGSDTAVKYSIEDITMTPHAAERGDKISPVSTSTQRRASLAKPDNYSEDDDGDDDERGMLYGFMHTKALGMSEYDDVLNTPTHQCGTATAAERELLRLNYNNNISNDIRSSNSFDGSGRGGVNIGDGEGGGGGGGDGDDDEFSATPNCKCRTKMSTNYKANYVNASQAVDI